MTRPVIPSYTGQVPDRNQEPTTFSNNADDWLAYQAPLASDYNALAEFLNKYNYADGGFFTPTAGQEYPTPPDPDLNAYFGVVFPVSTDTYTYTSGNLSGVTVQNGTVLRFDNETSTWEYQQSFAGGVSQAQFDSAIGGINTSIGDINTSINGINSSIDVLEDYKEKSSVLYQKTIVTSIGEDMVVLRKGNQVTLSVYGAANSPANNGVTLVNDVGDGYRPIITFQFPNGTSNASGDFRAYGCIPSGEVKQYQVGTGTMLSRLYITYTTDEPFPVGDEAVI